MRTMPIGGRDVRIREEERGRITRLTCPDCGLPAGNVLLDNLGQPGPWGFVTILPKRAKQHLYLRIAGSFVTVEHAATSVLQRHVEVYCPKRPRLGAASKLVQPRTTAVDRSLPAAGDGYEADLVDVAQLLTDNADVWWRSTAQAALTAAARTGQPFTAEDLTQPPYGLTEPDHPNRWGSLFAWAKSQGLIARDQWVTSRRPGRNAGGCWSWIGTPEALTVGEA